MDVSNRMGVPLCSNNSERVIIHEESLEFCLCQPIPVPYLAFRDPLIPVPYLAVCGIRFRRETHRVSFVTQEGTILLGVAIILTHGSSRHKRTGTVSTLPVQSTQTATTMFLQDIVRR